MIHVVTRTVLAEPPVCTANTAFKFCGHQRFIRPHPPTLGIPPESCSLLGMTPWINSCELRARRHRNDHHAMAANHRTLSRTGELSNTTWLRRTYPLAPSHNPGMYNPEPNTSRTDLRRASTGPVQRCQRHSSHRTAQDTTAIPTSNLIYKKPASTNPFNFRSKPSAGLITNSILLCMLFVKLSLICLE